MSSNSSRSAYVSLDFSLAWSPSIELVQLPDSRLSPFGLLLMYSSVGGVVPLIDLNFAPDLRVIGNHPRDHLIEEVPVVRDDDHTSIKGGQCILQEIEGKDVQVICRFIQEQEIGFSKDKRRNGQSVPFSR